MTPASIDHNLNLAFQYQSAGRIAEAEQLFRGVLQVDPNNGTALLHLGGILKDAQQYESALDLLSRLTSTYPHSTPGWVRYGFCLLEAHKPHEAEAAFRKALAIQPDFAYAHYGLAWVLLARGDMEQGWAEHEWRLKCTALPGRVPAFPQPRWDGSALNGRTILVHQEQGLGDVIQFARFVPQVAQRGGRVILGCASELTPLLRTLPGVAAITTNPNQLPPFDTHISLHSLPSVFQTTLATLPRQMPYLYPDPALVRQWQQRVDRAGGKFHVGLCWSGNAAQANDRNRSIPLAQFAPLQDAPNVRFYSIQKGLAAQQLRNSPLKLVDWGPELNDFGVTAAAMATLDLIVTVDTSVAHLAGATARPVFALVPRFCCWRWMLDRFDSPWYPTMRLCRQPATGDWVTPIQELSRTLSELARGRRDST